MASELRRQRLNDIILDIEFLIISVIQGAILITLAAHSEKLLTDLHFEFWPYIINGFLFILIFWVEAIVHSISFINWPLNPAHSLLYFLSSFVELILFSQLDNPLKWFVMTAIFLSTVEILYLVDDKLIKRQKNQLVARRNGQALYSHIISGHTQEMRLFVPMAISINIISLVLIYFYPGLFLENHYHLILVLVQFIVTCAALANAIKMLVQRSSLIAQTTLLD